MFRAGLCSARYCIREAVRSTELRDQVLHRTVCTVPSRTNARHGTGAGRYCTVPTVHHRAARDTAQTARSGSTWAPGGVIGPLEMWGLGLWAGGHGIPSLAASPQRAGELHIAGDGHAWC